MTVMKRTPLGEYTITSKMTRLALRAERWAVIDEFYEAVRDAQARAMQSLGGVNAPGSRSRSYGVPSNEECSLSLHQRYRQAGANVAADAARGALDAVHRRALLEVSEDPGDVIFRPRRVPQIGSQEYRDQVAADAALARTRERAAGVKEEEVPR